MRLWPFVIGIAAGMAAAVCLTGTAYPDLPRRMMRDTKRMCRMGKRAVNGLFS